MGHICHVVDQLPAQRFDGNGAHFPIGPCVRVPVGQLHSALIGRRIWTADLYLAHEVYPDPGLRSFFGFTAGVAVAAGTTVYRSEGPNGTVHFSDTPPAEAANTEVLHIRAPEGGDPTAAQQ